MPSKSAVEVVCFFGDVLSTGGIGGTLRQNGKGREVGNIAFVEVK